MKPESSVMTEKNSAGSLNPCSEIAGRGREGKRGLWDEHM